MTDAFLNLEDLIKAAGLTMPDVSSAAAAAPSVPVAAPAKKRKFMLVGTHGQQTTGYSKVTYNIIQELSKYPDIELYHFGFQRFIKSPVEFRKYPHGVDVFDPVEAERSAGAPQEAGFGFSLLPDYVRKVKPDVMMIYNDAGVICNFLQKLEDKLTASERNYKLIIYLDQVYKIQRADMLARIDKDADAYFTFTAYWKEMLEAQRIKKPIYVLRHGFDSSQFKVMDRSALRKKHGIPENVFILLNLNRNTPRKRYDLVITAFAELVARHPTKPLGLMCVCDGGENGGFALQEIYVRELDKRKVPVQFHIHKLMISKTAQTYTDELINELYALSDIGITGADGEGFGLCQFEAMGVGIPQVVPYIGGFRDFCKHGVNSLTVKPVYGQYLPLASSSIGGYIEVVDPKELALAAEEYIMDSELREKHGAAARETVLAYKWVTEVETLAKVIRTI